ncbi:hypothetical protein GCM10010208_26560 [Actinomadura livida]|nr:hypothetical protein GCM10010208_26560 [Actinomadura livida]
MAALPVRAWTVRTSAVATPSADTRSSVADVRWSGSAAVLPVTDASWHRAVRSVPPRGAHLDCGV